MSLAAPDRTLSWLTLEQYALGELDEVAARTVEARLAVSAADRERLDDIRSDTSVLPPLPLPAAPPHLRVVGPPSAPRRRRAAWIGFGGVVAAAAAWALTFVGSVERGVPGPRCSLKGGEELSMRVVSERGGDATAFAESERFKILITCPPAWTGKLAVVVFQGGERFAPLAGGADLACGNGVPWPGAFSLDGTQAVHVCVARAATVNTAHAPEALAGEGVCVRLTPRQRGTTPP